MELRYRLQKDMEKAPALIEETGREYEKLFGRNLGLVDPYLCDDAEFVFVTSGTSGYTARVAVDELRKTGLKAGNLRIKAFRPFPFDRVREVLAKVKKAAVVDRNCSYGAGGIFYQEVKSAVYGRPGMPPLFGYIAGLGGRDITTDSFKEVAADALAKPKAEEEIVWIGVKK
jgi:pyruvate/2-oxoacid:ferredoxin oxidoreductase alpha subunit